jgi:myo-inositol-1(or 4)-monophosphatase
MFASAVRDHRRNIYALFIAIFVWAVDPTNGTTNFVNGFPMFAASIGVLHRGVPVAGAVWCSVSHALRAGVYHASISRKLRFESNDVTPKVNADVLRRLAGVPVAAHADEAGWETRKTGSAVLECARRGPRAFPHRISGTWPRGLL